MGLEKPSGALEYKQQKHREDKMKSRKTNVVRVLTLVSVVSLCMAGNVMATEDGRKLNSTQLKIGIFQPSGDMDDLNYDNGGNFSAAYSRYLNRFVVLEAGFDIFASEQNLSGRNADAGSYTQDNTLAAVGAVVTVKGEYTIGQVDFFGGLGAGMYAVSLTSDIDSSRLGNLDDDDSDGVFGAHVVAGINYNINERFFLGMEGKYRWTDEVEIREEVASIPIEYSGDLSGYTVTFNGGFRF